MTDQQRFDTVSAYGLNPICRTPHIDGLAHAGVRFDSAFTPTAICSPARASFYTGFYPHRHGVTGNGLTLREGVRGINLYLGEAGYACGYAGKWHVDQQRGPSDLGFVGKDFLGYAFPGSGLLPGLQFGIPPLNKPNHYEVYLGERGLEIPTVSHRFVGTNPNNQAQEMFALHEIMPSVLDIAGLAAPGGLDGQSFLPAMLGRDAPNGREEVYCVFDRHFTVANQRMVRTRTHQLTFNSCDTGELYDLIADPYQLRNLYGHPDYEDVCRDLMARMERYLRELNDPIYRWFRRISAVY